MWTHCRLTPVVREFSALSRPGTLARISSIVGGGCKSLCGRTANFCACASGGDGQLVRQHCRSFQVCLSLRHHSQK
jgi:hypothetical protein